MKVQILGKIITRYANEHSAWYKRFPLLARLFGRDRVETRTVDLDIPLGIHEVNARLKLTKDVEILASQVADGVEVALTFQGLPLAIERVTLPSYSVKVKKSERGVTLDLLVIVHA